jgi:hypothetical protein
MIAGAARDGSTTSVPLRRIIPVVVAAVTDRLSKKSARARDSPTDVSFTADLEGSVSGIQGEVLIDALTMTITLRQ